LYLCRWEGIPCRWRVVKLVLDSQDVFPELEYLLCRCKRFRTDDRDRWELHTPQRPFLRHTQQLVDVELIRALDVENNLLKLGTQHDFGGGFVGVQGENEREVVAPSEREGSKVFHGLNGRVNAPRLNLSKTWLKSVLRYR